MFRRISSVSLSFLSRLCRPLRDFVCRGCDISILQVKVKKHRGVQKMVGEFEKCSKKVKRRINGLQAKLYFQLHRLELTNANMGGTI